MSCEQVRESLLDFLGDPQDPLPADLRAHLETCAACREEHEETRRTWAALGRMREEPSSERMRARFHAMLASETAAMGRMAPRPETGRVIHGPAWWTRRPVFQVGALAAALLVGVLLGAQIGSRRQDSEGIEALRAEMGKMTRAVTLSLLEHQSASERLHGIGLSETTPPDGEMVKALLRVVEDDPSANVRLAALERLASFPARDDVRQGLLASFPRQASPPVTAAMAAMLLELDDTAADDAVRVAARDDRLPDNVRQYLLKILAEKGKATGAGT